MKSLNELILDNALLFVLISVVLFGYGCSLDDVVKRSEIGVNAVSSTLDSSEPIVSAVERIPSYDGMNQETATKVENGLKTTTKNIEYVKAGLGIVKVAAPATAVYVEPAIKIIGGIGLLVTSVLGFVERRKRQKSDKIVGVVMNAVDPIQGVGAMINTAAKIEGVSDDTYYAYKKHVEGNSN